MTQRADEQAIDAVRFRVFGRVQGVGYRWWTDREATGLGVTGTVRNLEDGSVEVIAHGNPDQMDRLERALRRGPPMSEVERIERTTLPVGRVPADFTITR